MVCGGCRLTKLCVCDISQPPCFSSFFGLGWEVGVEQAWCEASMAVRDTGTLCLPACLSAYLSTFLSVWSITTNVSKTLKRRKNKEHFHHP